MKFILIVIGAIIGLSVLGTALTVILLPGRVVQTVATPQNAIYNYEWFKDKYATISAIPDQIAALDAQIEDAKTRPSNRANDINLNQLQSQRTGLISTRARLVAEYNSRASQITRNIFALDAPKEVQ